MVEANDRNAVPVISDVDELLRLGVVSKVPIDTNNNIDLKQWGADLSVVTPEIMTAQGDGEYAFYRNIMEEDFPFDAVLEGEIGKAILRYFGVSTLENEKEIRLDDAFCVHYNMSQDDTSGAKHMDPSDITVNLCLDKTEDCEGSQVMFYGTKALQSVEQQQERDNSDFRFLVNQAPGFATVHWGNHPHETTPLKQGKRTNVIMTYCYTDPTKSDAATRACYNV